jgi:hypothetical protein
MNRLVDGLLVPVLLLVGSSPAHAQAPETETAPGSPETAVRTVYDLVSWDAGEMADWDAVRAVFVPEARSRPSYRISSISPGVRMSNRAGSGRRSWRPGSGNSETSRTS